MARHHMTAKGPVPFSAKEEAEWDAMAEAWIPPVESAPTKEQLMAELAALTAKIQALE